MWLSKRGKKIMKKIIAAGMLTAIIPIAVLQIAHAERVTPHCTCEVRVCPGGRDCYVKMVPCACASETNRGNYE